MWGVEFGEVGTMGRTKERSKLLRSWIDKSKSGQAEWIVGYLSKKNDESALAKYLMEERTSVEAQYSDAVSGNGNALAWVVLGKILDDHSSSLIESDEGSRELMRSMRGAWQQKKYREQNGKQVSIMLPYELISEVDKVARDSGQSRTYTLEQMIGEAAYNFQRGSRRLGKRVVSLQKQLDQEKKNSQAIANTLGQWVDALSKALAQEVMARCECETMGVDGEEAADDRFKDLLEERVAELEAQVPALRIRRSRFRRVGDYFAELAKG